MIDVSEGSAFMAIILLPVRVFQKKHAAREIFCRSEKLPTPPFFSGTNSDRSGKTSLISVSDDSWLSRLKLKSKTNGNV